jgi:hypothetical protein
MTVSVYPVLLVPQIVEKPWGRKGSRPELLPGLSPELRIGEIWLTRWRPPRARRSPTPPGRRTLREFAPRSGNGPARRTPGRPDRSALPCLAEIPFHRRKAFRSGPPRRPVGTKAGRPRPGKAEAPISFPRRTERAWSWTSSRALTAMPDRGPGDSRARKFWAGPPSGWPGRVCPSGTHPRLRPGPDLFESTERGLDVSAV